MFDPYHKWLGIPLKYRPPTYYQLLSIAAEEQDIEVIEEAAIRQSSHLRTYQIGEHAALCTRLLNEISAARLTLLNPARRREYDEKLARDAALKAAATAAEVAASSFQVEPPRPPRRIEAGDSDDSRTSPRRQNSSIRKRDKVERQSGRRRSASSVNWWLIGGGGAATVVLLVGLVWMLLMRSNASRPVLAENPAPRPVNKPAPNKVANPEKKATTSATPPALPPAKPPVTGVVVAPKVADPAPVVRVPVPGEEGDWIVLMRSDDPSLWNQDLKIDANTFARSLATVPEDRVQFLKITDMQKRDFVITPMSWNQLANIVQSGRYGWEGRNHKDSGAYHLGIFDTQLPAQRGDVCIRVLPWFAGWGFGHIHFDNDKQGYCWAGRAIPKTTFEIAVSPGPLTALEAARLLKQ